jgi:hypothetical protein
MTTAFAAHTARYAVESSMPKGAGDAPPTVGKGSTIARRMPMFERGARRAALVGAAKYMRWWRLPPILNGIAYDTGTRRAHLGFRRHYPAR